MVRTLLNPLWDQVFKIIFGDQRHIDITGGFLKTVLDMPADEFEQLTIVDPFLKRFFKKDKMGILDVRIHTKSGKIINVEVQIQLSAEMRKRMLYYSAKILWEQVKRGESYDTIQDVVSIVLCDHILIPEETAYRNVYSLRNEQSGNLFTGTLKIITLELPKLPKEPDQSTLWPWLKFFTLRSEEEFDMLFKQYPEVGKAVSALKELSWSERRRMIEDAYEKQRKDTLMWIKTAQAEAREAALKEGREEALRQTARNLKSLGLSEEQIAATTGLSLEEVRKL